MFKKKHSEINIKVSHRLYSPLRSKSPVAVKHSPRNLSPIKNTFCNLQSKPQRKQPMQMQEQEFRSLSPRNFQNHFQSHVQNQAYFDELKYDSTQRFPVNKFGFRTELTNDMSYFSNFSNISKDGNNIKQSKRLFTKCIAEMNSQKKKVCANNNSNTTSLVQNSKQVTSDNKIKNGQPSPATSFKALKIQMIQSVLPPDKKFNTIQRKNSQTSQRSYKTKEFFIEQPKKQQIIELINQSFSNAGVSRINEQHMTQKKGNILQAKAKILESLYIEQDQDQREFDLIMQKIQIQTQRQQIQEIEHSVKISMQSERSSLNMNPFY